MCRFRMLHLSILATFIAFFNVSSKASYLHREGNKLYDDQNKVVRLTGVNWFGFETSGCAPHGLWARDWRGLLIQVKGMGFNCLRIPWSNAILRDGAESNSITTYGTDSFIGVDQDTINRELIGKTPIEILDIIIGGCSQLGLKVILDNHSRNPDGYMVEQLWYTTTCSDQQWVNDWVFMANRYKNNSTVVAFDLNNEPHGKDEKGATWGEGDSEHDWRAAAQKCGNAILKVNPDVLIIIEGVEKYKSTSYWWGGNLRGVKDSPINLSHPEKLVYSPHEYGPEVFQQLWFESASFPDNLKNIWDESFGFVSNSGIGHLLVGEFGIGHEDAFEGKSLTWFKKFLEYIGDNMSWTFWCLNPNSGDTGGLLTYDWITVEQWKLDLLKPYQAPFIGTPSAILCPIPGKNATSKATIYCNNRTVNLHADGPCSFRISSINGAYVKEGDFITSTSFSMGQLPAACYIVTLKNTKGTVTTPIILK